MTLSAVIGGAAKSACCFNRSIPRKIAELAHVSRTIGSGLNEIVKKAST